MSESIQAQERENQRNPFVSKEITLVVETPNPLEIQNSALSEALERTVNGYLDAMRDQPVDDLYELVLSEIEAPLLASVLKATRNNQSLASIVLGLNRGTLRKKLKKYDML
ncbi:MAG: Fis family transcriptional regulator [Candidatus Azotimanducaceae bacterium]|jgi:Fis family transcriptional regulator